MSSPKCEECTKKTNDLRMTLRMPSWIMEEIDLRRKQRSGKVSRTLFVLEIVEKALKGEVCHR